MNVYIPTCWNRGPAARPLPSWPASSAVAPAAFSKSTSPCGDCRHSRSASARPERIDAEWIEHVRHPTAVGRARGRRAAPVHVRSVEHLRFEGNVVGLHPAHEPERRQDCNGHGHQPLPAVPSPRRLSLQRSLHNPTLPLHARPFRPGLAGLPGKFGGRGAGGTHRPPEIYPPCVGCRTRCVRREPFSPQPRQTALTARPPAPRRSRHRRRPAGEDLPAPPAARSAERLRQPTGNPRQCRGRLTCACGRARSAPRRA